jgi:hypothetical protein
MIVHIDGGKTLKLTPGDKEIILNMFFGDELEKSMNLDIKGSCMEGNARITSFLVNVARVACDKLGAMQHCAVKTRNAFWSRSPGNEKEKIGIDTASLSADEIHLKSMYGKVTKQKASYYDHPGTCAFVEQSCDVPVQGKPLPRQKKALYCW